METYTSREIAEIDESSDEEFVKLKDCKEEIDIIRLEIEKLKTAIAHTRLLYL